MNETEKIDELKNSANTLLISIDRKQYSFTTDFQRMSLFFQSKQSEHMRNIILLEPTHDYYLICRSMIEGIALLLYAKEDEVERVRNWEESFWLSYYITYQDRLSLNLGYSSERLYTIEKDVHEKCKSLVSNKKTRNTLEIGDKFYYINWYKNSSITQIIRKNLDPLFKQAWSDFSSWHHWEPMFVINSVKSADNSIKYGRIENGKAVLCISTAIFCLMNNMHIVGEIFDDAEIINEIEVVKKHIEQIYEDVDSNN